MSVPSSPPRDDVRPSSSPSVAVVDSLKLFSMRLCFKIKLLPFYLCLLAILLQAIFASLSSSGESASLSADNESSGSKPKKAVGKLVKKRPPSAKKSQGKKLLKKKRADKSSKSKEGVVKENRLTPLIELLPKELVRIVLDYFEDNLYHFIISTHNWVLSQVSGIAVDSTRVYVLTDTEGIKGLDHSLANVSKDKRHYTQFGNSQWFDHLGFNSSHDGRYVSFSYLDKASTDVDGQPKRGIKWLIQGNESEGGRPKPVAFDGENIPFGLLSRDGHVLCSNCGTNQIYQVREEAGTDPVGFMKLELNAETRAVSGKGNRIIVKRTEQLEIHDISKDASKLVCQIDLSLECPCAMNEDGSEAAFINKYGELHIIDVDKVVGNKADQSSIVKVKIPKSAEYVYKLVYSDRDKLHMLHSRGKVSLFDPSTKDLILLEAPQEGQMVVNWEISPNADYIVILLGLGEGDANGIFKRHQTIVKRKCNDRDWRDLFGYDVDKNKQATKP